MSTPLLSVIVPTYRRPDLLRLCLAKLAPDVQTVELPYEVIVTDDDPAGTAQAELRDAFPWVRWVQGPSRGPAANRNHGAAQARGEWLVLTDDDCLPEPGWLAAYGRHLGEAEVLEGKTLADRPQKRFNEESPTNEHGGYLWSCNCAIKRALFMELGGYDEVFPSPAMEDVDFRIRVLARHGPFPFVGDAVVIHPWRKAKGMAFMEGKMASLQLLWEKHPAEKPASVRGFFFRKALQSLRRFPADCWRFQGRGAFYGLSLIGFWFKRAITT